MDQKVSRYMLSLCVLKLNLLEKFFLMNKIYKNKDTVVQLLTFDVLNLNKHT